MYLESIKLLTFYWTTRDPYDPVADFRDWLERIVGKQDLDWKWITWDVVPGETDERTVIGLLLPDAETEFIFLLANNNYLELYDDPGYRNIEG